MDMSKRVIGLRRMATALAAPSPALGPQVLEDKSSILYNKYLWGGIVICSLLALIASFLYLCKKKKLYEHFRQRVCNKGNMDAEEMMLRKFQLQELEMATNDFSRACLIGSGAFGNVYIGTFIVGGTLAIKRARADSYTSTAEFRNEVKLLAKVKHENLVGLVGYCEEAGPKGEKILVYEYVPNGSLLDYIVGRGREPLTWRERVNIAIGAAKGVAHLHEGIKPSIIHRDIKPSNILIGDGFEAKVSDFGLVKSGPIGDQSHVSSQVKGTPGYLDPAYCTSLHLSPFSDVYSFGVILLQLIAARPAVDTTRDRSNYHIIEWARPHLEKGSVEEILDANLLLEPCNMEMMLKMGQLGLRCVVPVPKQRPTMTQVCQELEAALYAADIFIHRQPARGPRRAIGDSRRSTGNHRQSMERESSVSIDGVGFQRFHVEMDSVSFQSASLRCLEANSISFDIGNNSNYVRGVNEEEMSICMDDYLSIPRD